jgi:hypothetical protein
MQTTRFWARREMTWAYGEEAMDRFTRLYVDARTIDLAQLAAWDLFAVLRLGPQVSRWGLDRSTEQTMRDKLRVFTAQALEASS